MKYGVHQCVGKRFRMISRVVDNRFRGAIKDFGITENQMTILFCVHKAGQIEQGKIGTYVGLERSSVSRSISILERMDYLERTQDYQPKVSITVNGNELVDKLLPIWEGIMAEFMEMLGSEAIQGLELIESKLL